MNEEGSTVGGLFGPNGFIQVLVDLFKTKWRLVTGAYKIGAYVKSETKKVEVGS